MEVLYDVYMTSVFKTERLDRYVLENIVSFSSFHKDRQRLYMHIAPTFTRGGERV